MEPIKQVCDDNVDDGDRAAEADAMAEAAPLKHHHGVSWHDLFLRYVYFVYTCYVS